VRLTPPKEEFEFVKAEEEEVALDHNKELSVQANHVAGLFALH
jgi:hypothetical protein